MLIPQRCKVCGQKLFEVEDTARETVVIKQSGTDVHTFNLRVINMQMKEPHKAIKKGKKYFFDVINSADNLLKIMCPTCKRFHLINLDKGIWTEVGRNDWPAA